MASTLSASLLPLACARAAPSSSLSACPLSAPHPTPSQPIRHLRAAAWTQASANFNPLVPSSTFPRRLVPRPKPGQPQVCRKAIDERGASLQCQASQGKGEPAGEEGKGEEEEEERPAERKPLPSINPLPWQMDMAGMLPLSPSDSVQPFLVGGPHPSPALNSNTASHLSSLTQSQAQGIILRAAMGTGWTTSTGLEGPSLEPGFPSPPSSSSSSPSAAGAGSMLPFEGGDEGESEGGKGPPSWPELTSSPRRTSRVKFTCNRCGERTVRAINPHAYGEGTVFVQCGGCLVFLASRACLGPLKSPPTLPFCSDVQCGGCLVFHKLVDNLNLFHELQGSVFMASDAGGRGFGVHESVDILGVEDPFPTLPFN